MEKCSAIRLAAAAPPSTCRRRRSPVKSKSWLAALSFAIAFLGASPTAWVHHSGAMFDRTRTIQISGVVKEFLWTNPHSSFKVDVPAAGGGEAQLWLIEMNATSNL